MRAMGTFFVDAQLAALELPARRELVKLLVDSGSTVITLEGRTLHTICLFGGAGDLDVLGAYTLEGFLIPAL